MGCGASKKKEDPKAAPAEDTNKNNSSGSNGGGESKSTASKEEAAKGAQQPKQEQGTLSPDEGGSGYVRKRRSGVSAEAVTQEQMDDDSPLPVHPKSDEQKERIRTAVASHLLFRNLEEKQLEDIVNAMFEVRAEAGKVVIRQGDAGDEVDNFYIVESGECEVLISRGGAEAKHFSFIKPGGYFGELALMYSTPRAATVQAKTDAVLWAVDRTTFRRILLISILQRRRLYEEFLASVPILEPMTSYETSNLCDALQSKKCAGEETVYSQGNTGDTFFIVEEGDVIVTRDGKEISKLGKGEAFGEVVLLTDGPYDATVRAGASGAKLVFIDRQSFNDLLGPCVDMLKRNMGLYRSLKDSDAYKDALNDGSGPKDSLSPDNGGGASAMPSRSRSRRTAVSSEALVADESFVAKVIPKTDDQRQRIRKAIAKNFLFSSLTEDILSQVIGAMFEVDKGKGDVVMAQGDEGDNFYILEQGECEFVINGNAVGTVDAGGSFGELALMYDSPRAATVRVTSDRALLWGVDRQSFRQLVLTSTLKKRRMYESFLESVPILSTLTNYERSTLADAFKEKIARADDVIIKQGDNDDASFYIVAEGEAIVNASINGEDKELKKLAKGDYFGEIALLKHSPRAANVIVTSGEATFLYIEGDAFHRLLGSIEDILSRNMDEYDQRMKEVAGDVTAGPVDL